MFTPMQFALQLANTLTVISLVDFFKKVHQQFYKDVDISFMEYFLELTDHDDEFVIEHQKLREYGVMTSTESGDVLKKIKVLGLVEGVDFTVGDVSERGTRGATIRKQYMLTPDAFKLCLTRALRRANLF